MREITIATHNGSTVARDHNIRNRRVTDKELHIDPNGVHKVWRDENARAAYRRLFGDALRDYNDKQSRDDRKIKDYFTHIAKDTKKHTVYEMIIGVYGTDKDGTSICDTETGKEIMRQFVDEWKERNPHLEMIGAYYHSDEEGQPHVHIDYIPWADGYTRGLEKQSALVKALEAQGFTKAGKDTAQILWERRENLALETICKERGFVVDHPQKDHGRHLDTETYKAEMQLSRTIDHYNDLDRIASDTQRDIEKKQRLLKALTDKEQRLRSAVRNSRGKVVISRARYDEVVDRESRDAEIIREQEETAQKQKETEIALSAKKCDIEMMQERVNDSAMKRAEKAEQREQA